LPLRVTNGNGNMATVSAQYSSSPVVNRITLGSTAGEITVDEAVNLVLGKDNEMEEYIPVTAQPKLNFAVQSPHTDLAKGKDYPLFFVYVYLLAGTVVTKTGALTNDAVTYVKVVTPKKTEYIGKAVCHPLDEMKIEVGAKLALARALAKGNFSKETRTHIWQGLFRSYPPEK